MFLFIHLSYVQEILIRASVFHPCVTGFRGHEEDLYLRPLFRGLRRLWSVTGTIRTQSYIVVFSWAKLNAGGNTTPVCISGNEVCFSLERLKALKKKEGEKKKTGKKNNTKGKEVSLSVSSGNIIKINKHFVCIGLQECSCSREWDGHTSLQNWTLLFQPAKIQWNCEMVWWFPEFPYLGSTHSWPWLYI